MNVDLHAHTTASDGSATPEELIALAADAGLGMVAVTDHDTVAGLPAARAAAQARGIKLMPGVELSADGAPGKCHLLGLGFDPEYQPLRETLERLSAARRERNGKILARLNQIGVPLTEEALAAHTPAGANQGRPHFAAALVAGGFVGSMQEAFTKYLAEGAAAHFGRDSLTPAEAIALVHDAGGLCFLAHPTLVRYAQHETWETRTRALAALGLDGIEVYYSAHTPADEGKLARLAARLGLLVTGGSDFHGDVKPYIALGRVRDGGPLDASLVSEELFARAV